MKKRLFFLMMYAAATFVVLSITSCNKSCNEGGNIDYHIGACIDETANIVGTYTGAMDTIPDSNGTQGTLTVQVTKVNDGEIQVSIPGMPLVPVINMEITDVNVAENGWLLTVPRQTNGGKIVSSGAIYFASVTDGYFATSSKTLQFCVMIDYGPSGTNILTERVTYLMFKGVQQ